MKRIAIAAPIFLLSAIVGIIVKAWWLPVLGLAPLVAVALWWAFERFLGRWTS